MLPPLRAPGIPIAMMGNLSPHQVAIPVSTAWGTPRLHAGPHYGHPFGGTVHDRLDVLEHELCCMKGPGSSSPMGDPLSARSLNSPSEALPYGSPRQTMSGLLPEMSPGKDSLATATTAASPVANTVSVEVHQDLLKQHADLIRQMAVLQQRHSALLDTHIDLMSAHAEVLEYTSQLQKGSTAAGKAEEDTKKKKSQASNLSKHPSIGVIRLDYNYPPAEGDTDSPGSFGYDVTFRVIPGLTFEMAQQGKFTDAVERRFAEGIKFLEHKGVSAITGDCGFMMAFQVLARKIATKPVFMSSMVQCPIIAAAFDPKEKILVLTANGLSLKPQKEVLLSSCGFDVEDDRFLIYGCQDLPGFDAVEKGLAVPIDVVQPAIVKMTMDILQTHKSRKNKIAGILLECTELPPYADALRASTGLPVWDCITAADFYVSGFKDNPRYGINDWQAEWDQEQTEYHFGENLVEKDREKILNQEQAKRKAKAKAKAKTKAHAYKLKKLVKQQAPTLGVLRLDYNYPPAAGDIDCPGSYEYEVLFRCVPGLTFEMAQAGMMTYAVQQRFVAAIKWLEAKGVCGITGDCGFMMAFQPLARDVASVPVFMSAMMQSPMVSVSFDKYDKILILTANSDTLKPQKETLLSHCGFDVDDDRFVIEGCQDVQGFDAVAKGQKVHVEAVTPGIVELAQKHIDKCPDIRAIILECTELPPYADALRMATGLPVWDAITCADFFISARKDNPRFGLNQWQNDWDGVVEEYKLGNNLSDLEKSEAKFVC